MLIRRFPRRQVTEPRRTFSSEGNAGLVVEIDGLEVVDTGPSLNVINIILEPLGRQSLSGIHHYCYMGRVID